MTVSSQYFSENYAQARSKFLGACDALHVDVTSFANPEKGPNSEELYVDACWIGPKDAEQVIVLISGTHGVEGFVGSACQIGWMYSQQNNPLPENMAVMIIHMINPYGCAWLCVETEENIDLNRNFVDYSQPLPVNEKYRELHSVFTCPEYEGPVRAQAEQAKQRYIEEQGFDAFLEAAASGQYQFADGFNFGGQQPAWSNKILTQLLKSKLSMAKSISVIDYHTGLGEYADAMLISNVVSGSTAAKHLQAWYGNIHFAQSGDIGYKTTGGLADSIQDYMKDVDVTAIVLEYGTFDIDRIAEAMLKSFWLTQFGDYSSELAKEIQQEIKECFYPNEINWNNKTFERSQVIINQTISGLIDK